MLGRWKDIAIPAGLIVAAWVVPRGKGLLLGGGVGAALATLAWRQSQEARAGRAARVALGALPGVAAYYSPDGSTVALVDVGQHSGSQAAAWEQLPDGGWALAGLPPPAVRYFPAP